VVGKVVGVDGMGWLWKDGWHIASHLTC